ncbi:hypothetical protein [Bradyrhizobium sp. HKCCYLS2033]|uniref:hypothetical protein n=1 Tax=unclassified Bradyrhizobium TaxID=2631580 RepID=UPI003EBE45E9
MNGELLPVWPRTWQEIWVALSKHSSAQVDLFMEMVSGLAVPPRPPGLPVAPPPEAFDENGVLVDNAAIQARQDYETAFAKYSESRSAYETAQNSEEDARLYFREMLKDISTEDAAILFLEKSHVVLVDYNRGLAERFRELLVNFVTNFNLRYEVRGLCSLHATIPGLFTKLISELKRISLQDPHLTALLCEFEEAFSDLKINRTQARMKTCLQKQYNVLEAFGRQCPHVTANTLGAICDQLDWPHERVKDVGKNLYRFGSDYPGLRHGGTPASALRDLEMKDFVSISLMLASFTPYVAHNLDLDRCYGC